MHGAARLAMNDDRERGDELSLGERFPRPPAVELAAAILIVGGVLGLIGAIAGATSLPPGTGLLIAATIALDVASIVVGVLIRMGRLWLVDVNYVAVVGFLDLTAAATSPLALILGIADAVVVVILLLYRPWFQRRAAWGRDGDDDLGSDRP
jgi:hypothetical protein